jgi:hypothetical protein
VKLGWGSTQILVELIQAQGKASHSEIHKLNLFGIQRIPIKMEGIYYLPIYKKDGKTDTVIIEEYH